VAGFRVESVAAFPWNQWQAFAWNQWQAFAWNQWQLSRGIRTGIGRSTAAAFIAACLHNPHVDEQEIAGALRRASPLARPNETLIKLADVAMRRNGRMSAAIAETGRDLPWIEVDEGVPFDMPSTFRPTPRH
jgi:hypothetical protein